MMILVQFISGKHDCQVEIGFLIDLKERKKKATLPSLQ
jgi:hypothetical protein